MQVVEVVLSGQTLIKVFKNPDSNVEAYYMSATPFSDIPSAAKSQAAFETKELAEKDARKRNSFRTKLVSKCETEYMESLENVRFII
jgi:hypothetical protein